MYEAVRNYVPPEWKNNPNSERVTISAYTDEYSRLKTEIECVIRNSSVAVDNIIRIQDVYSFGQFLIRSQLLAISGNGSQYYTVRRFMKIASSDLERAIKYNLDYRRCSSFSSLRFTKTLSSLSRHDVIVVVQLVTNQPNVDGLEPSTFLEYYIEYIVTLS